MRVCFAIVALGIPSMAAASGLYNPQPTMNQPNYSTQAAISPADRIDAPGDTPTMRRQKVALALALREEAADLLASDGGTLTPRNRAYIERKARRILNR